MGGISNPHISDGRSIIPEECGMGEVGMMGDDGGPCLSVLYKVSRWGGCLFDIYGGVKCVLFEEERGV